MSLPKPYLVRTGLDEILDGLHEGDAFPPERELAARFQADAGAALAQANRQTGLFDPFPTVPVRNPLQHDTNAALSFIGNPRTAIAEDADLFVLGPHAPLRTGGLPLPKVVDELTEVLYRVAACGHDNESRSGTSENGGAV